MKRKFVGRRGDEVVVGTCVEGLDRTALLGHAGCGNHDNERASIAPAGLGELGGRAGAVEQDHFRTECLRRQDEGATKSGGQPVGVWSAIGLDHDLDEGTTRRRGGRHVRRGFARALRW